MMLPPTPVSSMWVVARAANDLLQARTIRGHRLVRVEPVGCAVEALQVGRGASVFAAEVSSLRRRGL